MAHLIHGTFPAVAGVFHTKGYLMDETSNQGMSGYEAYKEELKQKQLAAALRQQELAQQYRMSMQDQQEFPSGSPKPLADFPLGTGLQRPSVQQQPAPQGRTSGLGLIDDLKRKQLPYGEIYRRPKF